MERIMTTPIDPQMCVNTGRLLTEWFEYPEYTDEDLRKMALDEFGMTEDDIPKGKKFTELPPEQAALVRKVAGYIAAKKRRKWRNGMSMQEVQYRMNEATKMVSPDNYKFLDDDTRERTGLEINPLWMMEALVRSGVLAPKEQVAALKELAQYTHSKAPNISHNTNLNLNPEDWLMELAKDEYKVLGEDIAMKQPMQPVERGMGATFEVRREKKLAETARLVEFNNNELAEMEALIDAEWEEPDEDA